MVVLVNALFGCANLDALLFKSGTELRGYGVFRDFYSSSVKHFLESVCNFFNRNDSNDTVISRKNYLSWIAEFCEFAADTAGLPFHFPDCILGILSLIAAC